MSNLLRTRYGLAPAMTLTLFMGCVAGGPSATYTPVSGVPSEPMTLNSVNRNWTGARAQVRYPFRIGRAGSGEWTESQWIKSREDNMEVQLLVTNREALREVIPKKNLLVGTALICEGWNLQRPKRGKDLQVDFRFENYPSKARMVFQNKNLDDLPEVEKFIRLKVLKLYSLNEQLVQVGTPAESADTASPSGFPGSHTVDEDSYIPSVEILSVSIRPARAQPGEEIDLIIHYRLEGVSATSFCQVVEQRHLRSGDKDLASFRDVVERTIGSYTSTKRVRIPTSAPSGVITFKADVSLAGSRAEAIFEIF